MNDDKQYFDLGEKILVQLNHRLNEDILSIDDLHTAVWVVKNIKESRVKESLRSLVDNE